MEEEEIAEDPSFLRFIMLPPGTREDRSAGLTELERLSGVVPREGQQHRAFAADEDFKPPGGEEVPTILVQYYTLADTTALLGAEWTDVQVRGRG